MPITVECRKCGKAYRVGDDKAGMRIKCKECQAVIPIPQSDFLAAEADVEELDDEFDFRPRRGAAAETETSTRKRRSNQQPRGWRSAKVQYTGAAVVVVAAAGVVLLILQQRGMFDRRDVEDGAAESISDDYRTGFGLREGNSLVARGDPPPRYPLGFTLTLTKNGKKILLNQYGWVESGPDVDSSFLQPRLKVKPATTRHDDIVRESAQAKADRRNLRLAAFGMWDHHEARGSYPASYMLKSGLSWRVHLLPYVGQKALFEQFKLDEPWDSDHNKSLISKMPPIYRTSSATVPGTTTMHVFVGSGTPFGLPPPESGRIKYDVRVDYVTREKLIDPNAKYVFELTIYVPRGPKVTRIIRTKELSGRELQARQKLEWHLDAPIDASLYRPTRIRDIVDGVRNVIMAVIGGPETAAVWTKPGGLPFNHLNPLPAQGTVSANGIIAVNFTGQYMPIPADISPEEFSHMIRHNDGNNVERLTPKRPKKKLRPLPD